MKNLGKRILTVLLSAALLMSLAACGRGADNAEGENKNDSFVFGLQTQPTHFDPYLSESADARMILFNLFEGLVKPDKDGNLNPALAETYELSKDAKTYTFHLRGGVKFHNGKEMTAADVKYSLDLAAGLSGGEVRVSNLSNIQSVEATDDNTISIHLKEADYDFLPYLTVAIIPEGYTDQDAHPVGTGPYRFVSFAPQQSIVLEKNPDYWQEGLPHIQTVTFKLESDSNALLMALQGGSVDGASIAENVASQLGDGFQIILSNSNSVQLLALNNKAKPFDDVRVRQAVSYAVDPDEIINTVESGKGVRCGTPVIPGLKKYFDNSLTYAYDVQHETPKEDITNYEKAKQLLKQAGYPDGFRFTITVPSNYTVHVDTAQVIVNELKQAGIDAEIKQVDFATWLSQAYTNREYEATIVSVDGSTLSPRSYLSRYVSDSAKNFVNYSSAEFDAAYQKAEDEPDEEKRVELYKEAQKILSKDAASVYIQDISNLNALKNGVEGFTSYPLYVFDASVLTWKK